MRGDPFAGHYDRWLAGDLDERIPGGESGSEVVGRLRGVLSEIADRHRGETVLVVSHGGVLRVGVPACCRCEATPRRLGHTEVVEVAIDGEDWVCRSW